MGFGGGGTKVPDPEPIPQVPVRDDPNSLEVERQQINRARKQDGYNKHLLSGGPKGDTSSSGSEPKKLIG